MSTYPRRRLTSSQRALLVGTTIMSIAVLVAPAWIEAVFGVSPDHGDGSLEVIFAVGGLVGLALSLGVGVRWYRRSVAAVDI